MSSTFPPAAAKTAPTTYRYDEKPTYTTSTGHPIDDPKKYLRAGTTGPLLLQDFHLIDLLAHFDRERIPERVVHAKGAGAFGEFELTHNVSDLTSAAMLNGPVGKKTPLFTRFSTVGGEKASPDTARDPRGFSVKLYTEEGNWDWVFNNTPVFFLRDPTNFPTFIHTQKRHPQTNLKDATMFWDYLSTHQESTHQVMVLFSDRGTPYSYRFMHGYSGHTYKWTKPDGSFVYVQVHLKSEQGVRTLSNEEAAAKAGSDPDWATQDLFDAIASGDYPRWTVAVQTMTPQQAEQAAARAGISILDLTKVWPQKDYPLRPVGRITLNRNVQNYFAEVEQAAFAPSNLVPGVEASADPVLQSRLFSYADTHRHRLGPNFHQIPVNAPRPGVAFNPLLRDGLMAIDGNYGSNPGYQSSYRPLTYADRAKVAAAAATSNGDRTAAAQHAAWAGDATWAILQQDVTDNDFVQPRALWDVMGRTGQQAALVHNVSVHLAGAEAQTRKRTYAMFARVHPSLGQQIEQATEKEVQALGSSKKEGTNSANGKP